MHDSRSIPDSMGASVPMPANPPKGKSRRGCFLGGCLGVVVMLALLAALAGVVLWNTGYVDDQLAQSPITEEEDEALAETYWAYSRLNDLDRECYRIILKAIETREPQRYPHEEIDNYGRIYQCVLADHPELFYVSSLSRSTATWGNGEVLQQVSVEAEFTYPPEMTEMLTVQVEAKAAECLAGLPKDADDYAVSKYLYDWISQNVSYDHEAAGKPYEELAGDDSQNIKGALVEGTAVCGGYASAYQYLMQKLGYQCVRVIGYVGDEHHAWCMAKLDGEWYHIDPTWGDPQSYEEDERGADAGYINYDYLNLTSEDIGRTHRPEPNTDFAIPICKAVTDNYYVREQLLFAEPDQQRLGTLAAQAEAEHRVLQVRCLDSYTYDQLKIYFVETGDLAEYLQTDSYRYSTSDENRSITILFK